MKLYTLYGWINGKRLYIRTVRGLFVVMCLYVHNRSLYQSLDIERWHDGY